ncbi:hypothetical protein CVIRNUC_008135 [Coccomyxa viridis]|uniref:Vacuolar protein sorting-associated protein 28 homolog n=1 Tax=Coccomyxa viridis TaxID=1274662 RepID=A0AAV1IER6_9CHLO|nr:hypothetical protein CVIRNUC_008135 [Coccomyxa viridis]
MSSHEEAPPIKLCSNKKEQEKYENLADLFAIVKTTEKLERAYVRDAISAKDYEPLCEKLIAQFRTLWETLRDMVPDVEKFMADYNMQCPMAAKRLIYSGMPATVEHGKPSSMQSNSAVAVAETVQHFITAMDSLKLNMVAVDQLYPVLNDLMQSMNKIAPLPGDFSGKVKMKNWISKLHKMPASRELDETDSRQLLFDLESSYNDFMAFLNIGRS